MKKFLLFTLLTVLFTAGLGHDAFAQKKKKKKSDTDQYFDESGFVNKLWYGGGFVLGFAGSGQTNQFSIGVTPMVGYKIVGDVLSVGPRIGFVYNAVKGRGTDGAIHKVKPNSYTFGAFARGKITSNFFAQLEYENETTKSFYTSNGFLVVENGKVLTVRESRDNVYIGAGYNSGGIWAYEIMLLYNATQAEDSIELPINFRFGITHKF